MDSLLTTKTIVFFLFKVNNVYFSFQLSTVARVRRERERERALHILIKSNFSFSSLSPNVYKDEEEPLSFQPWFLCVEYIYIYIDHE